MFFTLFFFLIFVVLNLQFEILCSVIIIILYLVLCLDSRVIVIQENGETCNKRVDFISPILFVPLGYVLTGFVWR